MGMAEESENGTTKGRQAGQKGEKWIEEVNQGKACERK